MMEPINHQLVWHAMSTNHHFWWSNLECNFWRSVEESRYFLGLLCPHCSRESCSTSGWWRWFGCRTIWLRFYKMIEFIFLGSPLPNYVENDGFWQQHAVLRETPIKKMTTDFCTAHQKSTAKKLHTHSLYVLSRPLSTPLSRPLPSPTKRVKKALEKIATQPNTPCHTPYKANKKAANQKFIYL